MKTQDVTINPDYAVGQLVEFHDRQASWKTGKGEHPKRFDRIVSVHASVEWEAKGRRPVVVISYRFEVCGSIATQDAIIRVVEGV